ncbi:MAG: polysaccharide deacetylase [Nakamurella sp.]
MRKLAPGEKAPQFVIFSFDGAGSHEKWQEFMAAAEPTNSRFVGFLTGIYLLASANKDKYQGPGHSAGKASIGFGGEKDEIITEINDLNQAYAAGHEIGTHYNGHFCSDNPPSGATWSAADWESELGQFMTFLTDHKKLNGWGDEVPDLRVTPADIKGGRTPCLEGTLDAMAPAWKKFDLTYDSSLSTKSGISWPVKMQGIWEFEMPYIYSPGFEKMILAMDYNFMCEVAACDQSQDVAAATRPKVRATYDFMYEQAYNGSRAPVLIANHFNKWNGDAYNKPALEFMQDTCGKKDTYCATYQDVIAWMELQDPAVLAKLQGLPAVAAAAG